MSANSEDILDAETFGDRSATYERSWDFKKENPPSKEHQACHKVPNVILFKAYELAESDIAKEDIIGFAHSSDNIFYSTNNKEHTRMELDLSKDHFEQNSEQKGGSIVTALKAMHANNNLKSTTAITCILKALKKSGKGYKVVVSENN